jgi:hypothetical protein
VNENLDFVWTMSFGWLVVWQSHLTTYILGKKNDF